MDPVTMMILGSAASKAVGALGGAISGNAQSKRSAAEAAKDRDAAAKRQLQDTALAESGMDPFRHSLAQINAASEFDKIQNTRQKTVSIPGLNPKFMPTLGGGYQASDELRSAAGQARTNVLGGQGQAPTQTNAANYGQTGVMNLIQMLIDSGKLPPDMLAKLTGAGGSGGAGMLPGAPANRNTGVAGGMQTQPVGQPFALSF